MKKGTKITLIVLGCLLAIGIAFFVTADVMLSSVLTKEVNKALAELPGCEASVGDIDLRFFSGTADVTDLHFAYRGEPRNKKDTVAPGFVAHVDRIAVLGTGAYNYAMASNYNRVPKPAMIMVANGASRLVIRAQNFEDMIACEL